MEQHAVPRQVTSFEFKLIGFMSVKQFIYLIITTGLAVSLYFLIPIPFFNFILAGITAALGAAFTFLKYNERSVDTWMKNFYFAVTKPSKFAYLKNNPIPDFLRDVFFTQDDDITQNHIDASQKLSKYINSTGQGVKNDPAQQHITRLIIETQPKDHKLKIVGIAKDLPTPTRFVQPGAKQPVVSGVIKNGNNEPLPEIMMYVNSETGQTIRILKSNHNGVFATFHNLPHGLYTLNPKDLNAVYFFDTMNITIDGSPQKPVTIYSKETL